VAAAAAARLQDPGDVAAGDRADFAGGRASPLGAAGAAAHARGWPPAVGGIAGEDVAILLAAHVADEAAEPLLAGEALAAVTLHGEDRGAFLLGKRVAHVDAAEPRSADLDAGVGVVDLREERLEARAAAPAAHRGLLLDDEDGLRDDVLLFAAANLDAGRWVLVARHRLPDVGVTEDVRVREAGAGDNLSGHVALPQVVRPHGGERVDRILIGDNGVRRHPGGSDRPRHGRESAEGN